MRVTLIIESREDAEALERAAASRGLQLVRRGDAVTLKRTPDFLSDGWFSYQRPYPFKIDNRKPPLEEPLHEFSTIP